MKTLLPFLLVMLALLSYLVVSTRFGIFQRYPLVHYILAGIGLALLLRLTFQQFTAWRLIASVLSAAAIGFFLWWTLIYSTYKTTDVSIAPGEPMDSTFAGITLKTAAGDDFNLGEEIRKQPLTLLVFYRGIW